MYMVKGTSYMPAPEGLHGAVAVDVQDLGLKETPWGAKEKIRIVFELDPESAGTMTDGRRYTIGKTYTPSLHEKAALSKDLKSWRGRPFTAEELAGFDVETVIGAPCKLLVQHVEKDGQVYANITAITKADKGQRLTMAGTYVRLKDRPEQPQTGNGGKARTRNEWDAPDGEDVESSPPF